MGEFQKWSKMKRDTNDGHSFTFWQLGNTIQDMQNRMFTAFMVVVFPPTFVNAIVPKFHQNMTLWTARELPSRIYGWIPFCTAMAVAEVPIAIVSGTICKWRRPETRRSFAETNMTDRLGALVLADRSAI